VGQSLIAPATFGPVHYVVVADGLELQHPRGRSSKVTAAGHFLRVAAAVPFLFLPMPGASAVSQPEAAMILARSGQTDEAIRQLRARLASGKPDPDIVWDLVVLLLQTGRTADAVE